MPFGAMLESFGVQVGGCGGLSWSFGNLLGVYVGSCRTQMGVWEAQRPQGRDLEGFGLAQRPQGRDLGWLRGGWGPRSGPNMGPT